MAGTLALSPDRTLEVRSPARPAPFESRQTHVLISCTRRIWTMKIMRTMHAVQATERAVVQLSTLTEGSLDMWAACA